MRSVLFAYSVLLLGWLCSCSQKAETVGIPTDEKPKKQDSIKVSEIGADAIPKTITFEGNLTKAVRWRDDLGDNIVVLSESGLHRSDKFRHEFEDSSDAELFAHHYTIKPKQTQQVWKMYDFVTDCPVDIVAQFFPKFPIITDLDHNGIAEVWVMYKVDCHGDVSPVTTKLIMYEGNKKYAMRGDSRVQVSADGYVGGDYQLDKAFRSAPLAFKDYAVRLWKNNLR